MKNLKTLLALVLLTVVFVSCADTVTVTSVAETNPHIYGFWGGLWHGFIVLFAWVGSWFSNDIAIYAVANNGAWYDAGFMFGISGTVSGVFFKLVHVLIIVIDKTIEDLIK